jgi:hypothetical protein
MKKSDKLPQKRDIARSKAIEMIASDPDIRLKDVAAECGVSLATIKIWNRDSQFIEDTWKRFMVLVGRETPLVVMACAREAKAGNVQAMRLFLEQQNKLVKNINVTVDSPWEAYFNKSKERIFVSDADYEEVSEYIPELDYSDLPPSENHHPKKRIKKERKQLKDALEREKYNAKQRDWYQWKKRAKAVGVKPLSAKRPTPGQRKAWEKEIINKEKNGKTIKQELN